jgi:hypothetical protein
VDDILIIYDANHTDFNILHNFNTIHPQLKFTAEQETNNQLNYLDITIHRTPTNWDFAIYRKPTFTDNIIPYGSNHPNQHKYATVRFLYDRLNTYNLQEDYYNAAVATIQNILHNNCFPISPPTPHPTPGTIRKQSKTTHTHKPQHQSGLLSHTLGKKPPSSLICSKRPT